MNSRISIAFPVLLAASLQFLTACGDADRALKGKTGEGERAQSAAEAWQPTSEWTLRNYEWKTAHPYANRAHDVFTITEPGAASIRVHFSGFHVETGYDLVKVSAIDGSSAVYYSGKLNDFWSHAIPGSTVRVEFVADASVRKYGFDVIGYAAKSDGETWSTKSFVWHTQHPYKNDTYQVVELSEPEAVRMKILFGEVITEKNYDFVRVYDEVGRMVAEYSGNLAKFETPAFAGKRLYVTFSSDESITAPGVSIAQYSYVAAATEPGCFCTAQYAPVCGMNGKTYSNNCAAGCEEAPIKHDGECGTQGDFCGGIAAIACADGWRCESEGSWADAGGSCVQ